MMSFQSLHLSHHHLDYLRSAEAEHNGPRKTHISPYDKVDMMQPCDDVASYPCDELFLIKDHLKP
jgi:hypothetical protein